MRQVFSAVLMVLLAAGSLSAATFEPVSDATLLGAADLVVRARVAGSESRLLEDGKIVTGYRLIVEDSLKGAAPRELVVTEYGGAVEGRMMLIPGSAHYDTGAEVIAFLRQRQDGTWFTSHMGLGRFSIRDGLAVRDEGGIETEDESAFAPREAKAFLEFLRNGWRTGNPACPDRQDCLSSTAAKLPPVTVNAQAADYVLQGGSPVRPLRWPGCEDGCFIGFFHNGVQSGVDYLGAMEDAADIWTSDPNSFVNIGIASMTSTNEVAFDDENVILINSNADDFGICQDSLGCGIVWATGSTHSFDGSTFYSVLEADLIIRPTSNAGLYTSLVTHEMGHGLALKHGPSGSQMAGSIPSSAGLRTWDKEAMAEVYGNGVPCTQPNITGTSGGGTVTFGQQAHLSVSVTGSTPFTYQWFRGNHPDTSQQVGSSSTYQTPPVEQSQSYWVRVSNSCGSDDSDTILVTPAACTAPVITQEPAALTNVQPGGSTTLTVGANGTLPFTYRWYESATVGDDSKQVGTTQSFNTGALAASKSYWARVSNACGSDNSRLAVVTVGTQPPPCIQPTIAGFPANFTIQVGEGATLQVNANGTAPFTYQWYIGEAPSEAQPIAGFTQPTLALPAFTASGNFKYWVKVSNACGSIASPTVTITVACPQIQRPLIFAPPVSPATVGYDVFAGGDGEGIAAYEIQESTNASFTQNVRTFVLTGTQTQHIDPHANLTQDTRFYYRVRAFNACTGQPTEFSNVTSTLVTAQLPPTSTQFSFSVPDTATQQFTQNLLVPGFGATATNGDTFSITDDVPWLTIFPAAGALSAGGTTVQMTINPALLEVGSTNATIRIERNQGTSARGPANHAITLPIPVTVSKVTPVTPDPRDAGPPPGTLIIPAVAHADGLGSSFQSDVRIANVSSQAIDYEITFTPSGLNGTIDGKKTLMTIEAGGTKGLDDIVKAWFGSGTLGESGIGTLEIRPTGNAPVNGTVASSRTYAVTPTGTLGQFIPALGLDKFIGSFAQDSLNKISLQQIANSPQYRTNLGFVEGSGQTVDFTVRLLKGDGTVLGSVNRSLPPFGHEQTSLIGLFGNLTVDDGRVEVIVNSSTGKATAYASVLDNNTNDPLMVFPEQAERTSAATYVVPGVAEVNTSFSNFHTDMRIFNAGHQPVTVNLKFYPLGSGTTPVAAHAPVTIQPGQVSALDNILPSLFHLSGVGGQVVVDAAQNVPLVLTARTFSREADGGTYGQFIPGVTATRATGAGERGVELLQLEKSDFYRTNVGIFEVTGKPVHIQITAESPQGKDSRSVQLFLSANEFTQYDVFGSMGFGTVYNGRITIKVLGGEGRVSAYGSVIDSRTADPTYVPAQ